MQVIGCDVSKATLDAAAHSALYMPAVCAITHDPTMASFYGRLRQRGKLPKQALAAAMRKLAHIAWGVVHNDTPYQPNFAG